mgnify:CR=1 FL=1
MSDEKRTYPIDVTSPVEIFLNQNTGGLVVEFVSYGFAGDQRMQLRFEPKVLLEMMSAIPVLETEYGELIREKAKLNVVQ